MEEKLFNTDIKKVFDQYQYSLREKFEGNCYTSHSGADYMYSANDFDRDKSQSYIIDWEEFLFKATMKQFQLFQNYYKAIIVDADPEVEFSPNL